MSSYSAIIPKIDKYFSRLSNKEIEEIIAEYHNGNKTINQLIEKYELNKVNSVAFRKLLPPLQVKDIICPQCEISAWISHRSRGNKSNPFCPKCKEFLLIDFDPQKQIEKTLRKIFIDSSTETNVTSIPKEIKISFTKYKRLSFKSKVFLGSIVSMQVDSDLRIVKGKYLNQYKLFPSISYLSSILSEFDIDYIHLPETIWSLEPSITKTFIAGENYLGASLKELFYFWKELATNEAIEILHGEMSDNGLDLTQGEIVKEILDKLLVKYSVAKIYNLIYRAVSLACKFYTKGNSKRHASNTVIHNCKRGADWYTSNNKAIKPYNRSWKYTQSIMGQYFYNTILKVGDSGFNMAPTLDNLIYLKMGC